MGGRVKITRPPKIALKNLASPLYTIFVRVYHVHISQTTKGKIMDQYEIADAILLLAEARGWTVDKAQTEVERAVSMLVESDNEA